MKRSRFSEEQIIGILKEHQAGLSAKELCRRHGVSDATFYKWRSKYGGMEVSDAKKLKALEAKNAKLKKLLAEQMMDVSTLKEMLGKTFEARLAAQCCDLGHEGEAIQPETGMCLGWDRSTCLPAHIQAPSGYCSAGPFEGAVVRATAVWISAAAYPAPTRRLACELEEAVSDLPRRRINSP